MKVRITKPTRVNLLSGEVEVTDIEYNRLMLLGAVEPVIEEAVVPVVEEIPEIVEVSEPVVENKPAEPVKAVGLDKNIDFGNLWDAFKRG